MVPERIVEPTSKLNQAHIGYPWQPCEWQPSGNVTLRKQAKQTILTMKKRGTGGLGEKLNEICPAAKDMLSDLTTEALQ